MRSIVVPLALFLGVAQALPAVAQGTPPGYTAQDQAQQAKLEAAAGTWNCVDNPASKIPDVLTVKRAGNWYVFRETGDSSGTTYVRWSHGYQNYFGVSIDDAGSTEVATTDSPDPYNGTWTFVFPIVLAPSMKNMPLQPYTMKLAGNTLTTAGSYYDDAGKRQSFTQVCTKT